METHPWEDFSERAYYIFLDGNNRNFNPSNIERLSYRYVGVFYQLGGSVKGRPDLTRLRIAQAKLKVAQLDVGEKLGLVRNYGRGRTFRDEYNQKNRVKHREYLREWRRKNKK